MSGKRTITTSIALDGEKEFKQQMQAVNSELKNLKSDMAAVTSEFRGNANSMEALTEKNRLLKEQYAQQEEKVRALTQAQAEAVATFGENSKQADDYRQKLNYAKVALDNMGDELEKNEKYMDEAKNSTDGCATSIDEFGNEVKDAGEKALTAGDLIKANLASDAIKAGLKALADAIKSVTTAFAENITATAQHGDEIDKQSQKLQISAEEYQRLSFAADRCGTSIDTMTTAQKTLAGTDFNGSLIDAIDYVSSLTDEEERAAKATELFGKKAGQDMLPLLNSGADGIRALYQECKDLGGVMSNDAVAACATYQDSLTNLQTAFDGMKNNLSGDFLPAITEIMDGMTLVMTGNVDEGMAAIEQGIADFGTKLEELGPVAEQALQLIVDVVTNNLPTIISLGADVLSSLIGGILQQLPELIPTVVDLILTIVDALVNNVDLLVDAAIQLTIGIATGLIKAITQLAERIPEIIAAIVDGLVDGISDIADVGKQLIEGLWNGIKDMASWIGEKIKGFGQGILDGLKSFFGIASPSKVMADQVGKYLGQGVGEGFVQEMDRVTKDMEGAIPTSFDVDPKITGQISTDISGIKAIQRPDEGTMLASAVNAVSTVSGTGQIIRVEAVFNIDGKEFYRKTMPDFRFVSRASPEVFAK